MRTAESHLLSSVNVNTLDHHQIIIVERRGETSREELANINIDVAKKSSSEHHMMALQYYLTHPRPTPIDPAVDAHQRLLAQSQNQLKQLQIKHPSYHHPYYQEVTTKVSTARPHAASYVQHTKMHNVINRSSQQSLPALPVHTLNQNSNISAASNSTGTGTTSSQAPTQQSNATNSSGVVVSGGANKVTNRGTNTAKGIAASVSGAIARVSGAGSAKKPKSEPLLTQFHQSERLSFANLHFVWSEEHWKRVVFQDERKFNLDGPDGFSYYFHDLRNYERSLSQRPRGNSVFIYALITSGGPIHLKVSTTKQKPEACIEIILQERGNIIAKLGGNEDFIIQDHNLIGSTLPSAQEWLSGEGIKTQKWPTIAHDVNIMENVWGWLIREVYDGGRKFSRKDDLVYCIRDVWSRLPTDLVTNLYSTMPERISELYYTQGVYTNC